MTHPLGWPNALPPRRSPCRIDDTKGVHQHRCSATHRDRVESYRSWRDSEYEAAEASEAGTPHSPGLEPDEYWETHTKPTFRTFLQDMRERRDPEE